MLHIVQIKRCNPVVIIRGQSSASGALYLDEFYIKMATSEVDKSCSSSKKDDTFQYFDVMVLGRTGQGKSTLANKLLGIDSEDKELMGVPQTKENFIAGVIKQLDFESDNKFYFETDDGSESVTKTCKVLLNESNMTRVLDTMGFNTAIESYGSMKSNVECLMQILEVQQAHDLRFSRALYFLPNRGPPERAEGTLQEEIKVMYGYFGQHIFDIMVIIVTNNKRDHYQLAGFSEGDMADTREVFLAAFEAVTSTTLPKCPPVVYIPFNEHHQMILDHVKSAKVISDANRLCFSQEYPQNCNIQAEIKSNSEYKCTHCAVIVAFERSPFGEELPICVIAENGAEEVYNDSKCHPSFIPKYSILTRMLGGLGYFLSLSLLSRFLPAFWNPEKVCSNCREPPGSKGCCIVNQTIELNGQNYFVNHLQ